MLAPKPAASTDTVSPAKVPVVVKVPIVTVKSPVASLVMFTIAASGKVAPSVSIVMVAAPLAIVKVPLTGSAV